MQYACPACHRAFDEPGFCPFDGKPLAAAVTGAQTIDQTAPPDAGQVRAVSASGDSTGPAQAALRERVNEYDRLVGTTLDGRYLVQKKLGEGGMGVVFAARHAVIERPLAIKVLKREASRDPSTIKRFVQEAKAASRIGHPNIVDVTDFGTTSEGLTYSVMELVDGVTLASAIKAGAPFAAERAVHIAIQIARALGAAHDKGIVHRDLKPENVFLIDRDGRHDFVKIVDFGIAKVQPIEGTPEGPRLTRAGMIFGTPEYMAPEQAAGRSDTDHRVDVYALGIILYQMLVGKVPLKGKSLVNTIAMQMLDAITPPSLVDGRITIAPALETINMKALAKKREERYATMAELGAALEGVTSELAAPAVSLPPVPPGADPVLAPNAEPVVVHPRRAKPATRQLHEPEFVAGPLSLNHVFDDAQPPARRSRLPWVLAALALLAAGAAIVLVAIHADRSDEHVATAPADAVRADATALAEPIADVRSEAVPNAAVGAVVRDAGARAPQDGHTAGAIGAAIGPHPATIVVEVLTRPAETDVFVGHQFRGPSGTRLEEPYGTKLTVECRAPHFKGVKKIVFDGSETSVLCSATRLKMCVDGLKNPYDECEPAAP